MVSNGQFTRRHYYNVVVVLCILYTLCVDKLAEDKREAAVMDMQLVIGFYCKSRSVRYSSDSGWAELLLPLAYVGMSRADMYNCFYALLSKYIPK